MNEIRKTLPDKNHLQGFSKKTTEEQNKDFGHLYSQNYLHTKNYIASILQTKNIENIAEDIAQDTFLKVMHALKEGKYNNYNFKPLIFRIARNLAIDHLRKEKKQSIINVKKTTSHSDEEFFEYICNQNRDTEEDKPNIFNQIEQTKIFNTLLSRLPKEQQEIVIMRHKNGLTFKEIAEEQKISINTAIGRMRYALMNLRKYLSDNNISLDDTTELEEKLVA